MWRFGAEVVLELNGIKEKSILVQRSLLIFILNTIPKYSVLPEGKHYKLNIHGNYTISAVCLFIEKEGEG